MDFKKITKTNQTMEEVRDITKKLDEGREVFNATLDLGSSKDIIDNFIESLSFEEATAISVDKVKAELDGKGVEFSIKMEGVDKYEYLRDFIEFSKASEYYSQELDKVNQELEKDMEEINKEFEEKGRLQILIDIENDMIKGIENNPSNVELKKSLDILRDAKSLDNVLDMVIECNKKNLLGDYRNRTSITLDRYAKIIKKLDLKTNIFGLAGLEKALFNEDEYIKYSEYNDLLIFAVLKYITYMPEVKANTTGLFITTFTTYAGFAMSGQLPEEELSIFKERVRLILDNIIG